MLNRREAFLSAAVAAWAIPLTAAGADPAAFVWNGRALTAQQGRTLTAAAEAIVPATGTPGATQAGVAGTVDAWVADYFTPAEAAAIRGVLDRLDSDARAAGASSFADADAARQAAVLAKLDAEAAAAGGKAPFGLLKQYVTIAFFTSRPGATQALRYDPVPGAYRGCVPVKEIGRGWATS